MNKTESNLPAFPVKGKNADGTYYYDSFGLTKREYFAAMAMQGLVHYLKLNDQFQVIGLEAAMEKPKERIDGVLNRFYKYQMTHHEEYLASLKSYPANFLTESMDGKELVEGVDFYLRGTGILMDSQIYAWPITQTAVPLPDVQPGKEDVAKGQRGEDMLIDCLIFPVPIKEHWDDKTKCWIYVNEEYNISGYGKTKKKALDMFRYCVNDALIFEPPSTTPSSSPVEAAKEYAIKKYGEQKEDGNPLAGDTEDGIADFIAGYNFCKSLSIPVSISAKEAAKERYPLKIIAGLTRKESENIFTAMQEAFLSGASFQKEQAVELIDGYTQIAIDKRTLPKDGERVKFMTENEEWHEGYFVSGDDIFQVNDSVWFFKWHVHQWKTV